MSTALIHIGMPKTGTTAVQEMLFENRFRLPELGLNYPSFLRAANHVELAVYAADGSDPGNRRLIGLGESSDHDRFRAEFKARFCDATAAGSWVFSSEHLSSRLRSVAAVELCSGLFTHFDTTRIIIYVRRQDAMAAASHSTWVKDGNPRRFNLQDHLEHVDRYDFRRIIERWDAVFGSASVEVRLYQADSLLADFLAVLGVDPGEDWVIPRRRRNESFDSKELAFIREMNERLPRWQNGPTGRFVDLTGAIAGSGHGSQLRLAPADRSQLLERFRDSNDWVMARASNAATCPEYFSPDADESMPGTMDDVLEVDDVLDFARALWSRASALEKRLRRATD